MPPRTVKRGGSVGTRKTTRATKGTPKVQAQNLNQVPPDANEDMKVEEVSAVAVEEPKEKSKIEYRPVVEKKPAVVEETPLASVPVNEKPVGHNRIALDINAEAKPEPNGLRKEGKMKDTVEEYEKDERLDLEYNDPEYETEEYGGVDYDEKEGDQENVHEVDDEGDEYEDNIDEEDEGDLAVEELEDVQEELGEDYGEHTGEEQHHADPDDDEHHEVVKERRKRKEFEVFVGGLDKDATEDNLKKAFSKVGEVTEVRLMMNPQTKKNKGFAFLRFATVEQAKRAFTELKNPVINGKQCGVTPSQDSDTLFLGNICKTWTKEALKEKLKHYGVENVEDLTLVEDSNNLGMNRGFAFLEFSSRSEAMDAFKRLQKRDVVFGVDRPAKVSFADSFIDPGDEIMAQVKTVFVDGLSASWDEDQVKGLLKKYGEIEKIELARNMPSAKRKDFGFVTFDTHDAAVTCAKSINNAELGDGDSKAKVRARLSRPLQRGKGRHGGRGDYRSLRGASRISRGPWGWPVSRSLPVRGVRGVGSRIPPASMKRSIGFRDRRPVMSVPSRPRPLPPTARSYDRRAPVPSYPKSSSRREYGRRDEIPPPRSRPSSYGSRVVTERRPSYKDDYPSRGVGYTDPPRTSREVARRPYVDDGYGQRFERPPPPPSYREGRSRDYDSISGSKRPYSDLEDVPPRYSDAGARSSRSRLDYEYGSGASQYEDAYGDRLGRSSLGYGSSRTSQDSHGLYSSRQGMGYGGGSYGSDAGGIYSSSYGGEYMSRDSDAGGSSYSSMYSSRGVGGSSYMGSGGSGSYY